MTPASRIATAAELLQVILDGESATVALTNWARGARFAGSKDRAGVRDIVYDCLRRRRSFGFIAGSDESGRALTIAYAQANGGDLDTLFSGKGYAPDPLTTAERRALRTLEGAADPVALDYPDFLHDELTRSQGPNLQMTMASFQARAPTDLRVNSMKTTIEKAQALLAEDGIRTELIGCAETALRVTLNPQKLRNSKAYREGYVELQDASSQAVSAFAEQVQAGARVLDYCAGGGGKALALYASSGGKARVFAHDIAMVRMNDLPARAARAGARITILNPGHAELRDASFDVVFVDAPCSGSGSWRRNPDAKWRLRPSDLEKLDTVQSEILDKAAKLMRPDGTLIYATCSVLRRENRDRISDFLKRQPVFKKTDEIDLTPLTCGDGFYAAKLRRE